VYVGRNVWIGINVSIVPGVVVGDGAILGMGAVVTKDVAEMEIVGGNPARQIARRNEEHYRKLEAARKYGGVFGRPLI
jgi:acetyltransferase-like isoleucine patch superfamily enzyme